MINFKSYPIEAKKCLSYALFFIFCALAGGQMFAQAVDPTFDAKVNNAGIIYATAVQSDGKIIVGGDYIFANGQPRSRIARLNANGTVDTSFNATFNNTVYSLLIQPDGKILVGGTYTEANGQPRGRIARLNSDGSLDTSFDTSVGASSGIVYAIARQTDGKILVGGSFTTINGLASNRIARLNADGSYDASFNIGTGASSTVYDIRIQPDGKILVGGAFTTFNGVSSSRIVRLNADGTIDASFMVGTGASSTVYSILLQADNKIVISGAFANYNGTSRSRITRLNADGTLDIGFDPGTGADTGIIYALALESDGDIVLGGTFTQINGMPRARLARVTSTGGLDANFMPTADAQVRSLSLQADGKIIVGGGFSRVNNTSQAGLARLNTNGTIDAGFVGDFYDTATVRAILEQPDGKVLVGGVFDFANFMPRMGIARFNADGTADTAFNSSGLGADSTVFAIARQADGKIIIGGSFDTYNGIAQPTIARLNADGTLDASFMTIIPSTSIVYSLAVQPDGKILIGGTFTSVNGTTINRIARLNADGTLDASFNVGTGASSTVFDIKLTTDNKIYIGGSFTTVNGVSLGRIARLNADGTVDAAFVSGTGASSTVYSIIPLSNGKVIIGGGFTTYKGSPALRLARLNADGSQDDPFVASVENGIVYSIRLLDNGKILGVGSFTTVGGITRNRIARFNENGSLDPTFNPGLGADNIIYELTRTASGKYLIGGSFTSFNGVPKAGVARITILTGSARADFDGDGRTDLSIFRPSQATWYINRSTAGFSAVNFGNSSDVLTPADFDGDGITDIAVWRGNTGEPDRAFFYILQSSTGTLRSEQFGRPGDDPSVRGDWDGDGKADAAVYREGAVSGTSIPNPGCGTTTPNPSAWYYRPSGSAGVNFRYICWGTVGDRPVRGDFDGDGQLDAAVFRPSNGTWYILQSSNGQVRYEQWGTATDRLVPADYDGDGRTDLAVYRDGVWYILQSSNGQARYERFGAAGDEPVPGDYDGDGRDDIAVYRDGVWYINQSTSGSTVASFGTASDRPVPESYLP